MSDFTEEPKVVSDFDREGHLDRTLIHQAAAADQVDHEITLREAISQNKMAVFWCLLMSASLIMEGYDLLLLNSFYGLPSFLRKFGVVAPDGTLTIPPSWQNALSNGGLAGQIIGLLFVGEIQDRFGSRKTIMGGMAFLTAALFILFFANSLAQLVAGYVIVGLPLGAFQIASTVFASEVCPIRLRPYLTTAVCLCWG
jgi:SP family general alpha glucoside:H+ symporter-like MFS transporter